MSTRVDSNSFFTPKGQAWFIWTLGAVLYLYSFMIRVSPAVMQPELRESLQLTAPQLGSALSVYYFIYAPMQLLVGILFDRFGARRLLLGAGFLTALGCFILAGASSRDGLMLARGMQGFGSSFCFTGSLFLASLWFSNKKMAMISGLTTTLGMIGAICGEAPFSALVDGLGIRPTLMAAGGMGLSLTALLFFGIPKHSPKESIGQNFSQLGKDIGSVMRNPQTWIIGSIGGCLYLGIPFLAELWGVEFIMKSLSVSRKAAATSVSFLYMGWMIGAPFSGIISDRIRSRKKMLQWSTFWCTLLFLSFAYIPIQSLSFYSILLFLCGLAASSEILIFIACVEANVERVRATAIATANMIVMIIGAIAQAFAGEIMDRFAAIPGDYTASDYQFFLTALPVMTTLGFLLTFLIKKNRI